jgi:hypothetical protein
MSVFQHTVLKLCAVVEIWKYVIIFRTIYSIERENIDKTTALYVYLFSRVVTITDYMLQLGICTSTTDIISHFKYGNVRITYSISGAFTRFYLIN